MPPEREDERQEESLASRSYYRDRYKSTDSQSSSGSHQSPYWDAYGYGLKDNYGYSSHDQGQSYDYNYPSERIIGSYSNSCGSQAPLPGYRLAFQDPSFALGLFVVGALATYILFRAITDAGIGKKKRNLSGNVLHNFWSGLEEFEEKVDKIAEGQDTGDSWISQIFNQFSFLNDVDNQLTENDLDGIEPPILDETWGLGIRNSSALKKVPANTTVEEPIKLDNAENLSRNKRFVTDEDEEELEESEEKCRVDMWRCLSKVVEGGLHYIDHPEGLYGLAKKTMFKVAFHGGMSNMWSGLMTVPEARQIKQCMTTHTECVSYEILRREAQASMDPSDPAYEMYNKRKMKKEAKDEEEKVHKRERLIINPEFVESLDGSDGAEQFDSDYYNNEV